MNASRLAFALATALLLAGCTTPAQVKEQREAAIPPNQRAYVIGRYAVTCEPVRSGCLQRFNVIALRHHSGQPVNLSGEIEAQHGGMFGGNTVFDFEDPGRGEKGFYFCELFPAGSSAFVGLSFWNFQGGGSGYRTDPDHFFQLPFTLAAGEVAYVGRLKVTTETGRNMFGMKLPAPGVLEVSSSPAEDIAKALMKCPESVRNATVRDASLSADAARGHPLVRKAPAN